MNINQIRNQILQDAKPSIVKYGWTDDLFIKISKTSKYKTEDIKALFPKGNKPLIEMYLKEINNKMNIDSKKLNLIRFKVHERIRELIILRLKIMQKEKILITKTFYYLLMPQNYKLASRNLYKTLDQIWFLAGDNSTDFNFYTKRAILGSVYSATIIHFINNNNINKTIDVLNNKLKIVSKIPILKNRSKDIIKIIPQILKLQKKISFFKQ